MTSFSSQNYSNFILLSSRSALLGNEATDQQIDVDELDNKPASQHCDETGKEATDQQIDLDEPDNDKQI